MIGVSRKANLMASRLANEAVWIRCPAIKYFAEVEVSM